MLGWIRDLVGLGAIVVTVFAVHSKLSERRAEIQPEDVLRVTMPEMVLIHKGEGVEGESDPQK